MLTFQGGVMFEKLSCDEKRSRFERLAGAADCAIFNQLHMLLYVAYMLLYGLLVFEIVDSP